MGLIPPKQFICFWCIVKNESLNKRPNLSQKQQLGIKITEVMSRNFGAKCLLLTTNYGCFRGLYRFGLGKSAVFLFTSYFMLRKQLKS